MTRVFICLAILLAIIVGLVAYIAAAPLRHIASVLERQP
jgi:hypothetical protein